VSRRYVLLISAIVGILIFSGILGSNYYFSGTNLDTENGEPYTHSGLKAEYTRTGGRFRVCFSMGNGVHGRYQL
jgi:hypothetical protein